MPFGVSLLVPEALLANPPASPLPLPPGFSLGALGHDEDLKFPALTYRFQSVVMSDDNFDISVAALNLKTGEVLGGLLYKGVFVQTLLLQVLFQNNGRIAPGSFPYRGPASFENGPNGEMVFRYQGDSFLPFEGFIWPSPDFTTAAHSTARYWRDVGTIDNYYRSQMELLQVNSPFDPYNDALWPTYAFGESNVVNSPRTDVWGPDSTLDSVVSRRSMIFDARIVRSVISKAVRIETSAEIESSVLLPGVRVGRGARIRRAVIDEYVEIPEGAEIGYDLDMDRRYFQVSRGGIVVVPAEATIAPDAVWETSATAIRKWRA